MRHTRKAAVAVLSAAAIAAALAGCSQKSLEPYRDAPVSGHQSSPAEVIEMPDGFSNVADKCDGHGHRVYVVFHNDGSYGSVAAISDPTCPGGGAAVTSK
jgi:hypothetical protein